MNRGTIIALAAGVAGVLATSAFAGVAVYNAATVSSRADDSVVMAAVPQPVLADVSNLAPDQALPALPPLPEVPASPSTPETTTAPSAGQQAGQATQSKASPAAPALTRAKASRIALSEASGEVVGITARSRMGYQAWAVQIKRPDGSIVTGYVDRESGVAFDWVIDQPAPAATYDDDDDNGEDDEDEDESEDEGSDDDD